MSFATFIEVYKVLHRSIPELNLKKKEKKQGKNTQHATQHMASMLSTR